jgi:CRP/FNR family transcriptional regulator, cyclic AMP receptor protein
MSDETLTLIEKTAFMKSIPVFSNIPTEALAGLAAHAREVHCDPGDELFHEGDANRGAFLVIDGLIQVRRGRAVVRVMRAGMGFGELWLREGEVHQYTLAAVEHSHVLNVLPDDVWDAVQEHPEFASAMVRSFALRIHELTGRILDLERVIARLHLSLVERGIEPPELPETLLEPLPSDKEPWGVHGGVMGQKPWPALPTPSDEPGFER